MSNKSVTVQRMGSVAAVAMLASISAGCGAENSDPPIIAEQSTARNQPASTVETQESASPTSAAPTTQITIRLLAFLPEELSVPRGTEVRWRQEDPGAHTVTSGTVQDGAASSTERPDGRFDSGEIPSGANFSFTFSETGTFLYYCSLHPATMRGVVNVT